MVASADGGSSDGLTEYELARLEQVRRNQEKLASLGIPALASKLMPTKPVAPLKPKGISTKRRRLTEEALPRRTSSRLAGLAAEGGEVLTERAGKVTVTQVDRGQGHASPAEPPAPKERHPKGKLPFRSSNGGPATDEAFIQLLAHASSFADEEAAAAGGSGSGSSKAGGRGKGGRASSKAAASSAHGPLQASQAAKFRLEQDDVAKVTRDAIAHMAFHPTGEMLLLAAADKQGNLGLWHCSHGTYELPASAKRPPILKQEQQQTEQQEGKAAGSDSAADAAGSQQQLEAEDEDAGSSEFEGILMLPGMHYQYASGLKWAGGPGRSAQLFTVSYDGSVRALDVATGASHLMLSTEDAEFSCMDVTADGRTVLLGDNDGELSLLDCRQAKLAAKGLTIASKKVNTLSLDPGSEHLFASASTDTAVRLWDVRKLAQGPGHQPRAKDVASAAHDASCQGAYFAPDGSQRVLSTSFDNTVRVWDGKKGLEQLLRVKHNNNTGRYILPFRAQWTPASDGFVVGNMSRLLDVYDAAKGSLLGQLGSEYMTAIPARACMHPTLPTLAAATASGRVHLYR